MDYFDLLSAILLFVGAQPFHEAPQSSRWRKIHVPGLLFCVAQLTITSLGFVKEWRRIGATEYHRNNIILATITYKQVLTVAIPFVYFFGRLLRLRQFEILYEKTRLFDRLISREPWQFRFNFPGALRQLQETSRKWGFFAGLSLCVGEVGIIYIGVVYSLRTTDQTPTVDLFYFYQATVLLFVGTAFYAGIRLVQIKRRFDLLAALEHCILEDVQAREEEKKARKMQNSVLL